MKIIIFAIFILNLLAMGSIIHFNINKDYCNGIEFEQIVFETMEVER